MEKWRPLLLYQKFYWGLDNKALTYLNSSQSRVVLNWIGLFQEYDFETWFKKGVLNVLPHELSHMYDLVPLDFGRQEAKREGNENGLGLLVAYARGGGSGFRESKKKFIEEQLERVAPESQAERVELVKKTHMESHMGAVILYRMLWADGYFWPSMWKDIKKVTSTCNECVKYNVGRTGFHPMSTIGANRPWDHIVIDFIGLLPASERGYTFILIVVDVHSRFLVLKAMRDKSARSVAYALLNIFANFGVPKILQSDNEMSFVGHVLEEFRNVVGFKHRRIMNYFPRQNGVVERYVKETKAVLVKWIGHATDHWEYYIPAIQMSLND